ncbi:glycosyltransferase family 39 protein [Zunongwangia sp. SCSIO 43204]|uniref:glycosyltransferase family 39 protein n=1 Tax=Zunongwangia sp. SCSIO 43204 TaxID=2779359 RepID=UPI001CA95B7C|nr:glycosyltransferase family 39 protein [Zunongwangia sp. SCSIO 43204]UAB86155.1 glycosyltransferase family 39 protein [Zunongwangia sp. SCSIO 43204]
MKIRKLITFSLCLVTLFVLLYNYRVAEAEKYNSYGDAMDYVHLGVSLLKTGNYGHLELESGELLNDFKSGAIDEKDYDFKTYSTWRPPFWPYTISLIFFLFGFKLTHLIVFKMLLHIVGSFIFYKTLKNLNFDYWPIVITVFLYCVSPSWQIYSRVFLSEPITLFLFTVFIYLLTQKHALRSSKKTISISIVGSLIIICHPYFLFFPFLGFLFLLVFKQVDFKRFVLGGIFILIIPLAWMLRNSWVLETNSLLLTTSTGAVMAKGWNKNVLKLHNNVNGDLADETLVLADYNAEHRYKDDEVSKMNLYKDATVNFIKTHSDLLLPIILKKLKSAFNPFAEYRKAGVLEKGRVIYHVLGFLAMIFVLFSKNKITRSLSLTLIFSTICITIITYSGFRFRVPQSALELFFVAFLIQFICERIAQKRIISTI